jgi:transcriptional regulator with XRE-family HTH domain
LLVAELLTESTGARVRRYRRRAGLTQAQFGAQLVPPRSQSWVSGVESGEIELDSIAVLNAVARLLNVHPSDLTGQPYRIGETPSEDRGHAMIAQIRRQIERYDLPPEWDGPVRSVEELTAAVAEASALRQAARYTALAELCPPLIAELQAAAHAYQGAQLERVWGLLSVAYREADSVAHALGYLDLSILATDRVRDAAGKSGDRHLVAVGDYLRVRQLWSSASWGDALTVLDRTLDALEAQFAAGVPQTVSVVGSVQLRAAITAARRYDADEAWTRYAAAQEALDRLGPDAPDYYRLVFTKGNVDIHGVAIAVELGDGTEAVKRGGTLRVDPSLPASRAGHHYLDMARGWLWYGDRDRALAALEKADRVAPALVRHHPMARQAARTLLDQEQRGYRERVRTLAGKMHVL